MKQPLKTILISGITSIILLIIFFILQVSNSKVLALDNKWIIVSGVPILVGLFLSGIIKSFKGFGIELETNLAEKVELDLVGSVESIDSPEITKQSIQDLHDTSVSRKSSIERIQFTIGRKNYYDVYAVSEYLRNLRNLQYIEIINEKKEFIALLPSTYFYNPISRRQSENQNQRIQLLIKEIEDESIRFNSNAITDKVNKGDSLLEAYRKFEKSNQGLIRYGKSLSTREVNEQILPVIDTKDRMVGITKRTKLTDRISKQVLKSEK